MESRTDTTAERIRRARKAAGLTQEGLVRRMGSNHRPLISFWETGFRNPTLSSLRRVATACGCSLFDLIGSE